VRLSGDTPTPPRHVIIVFVSNRPPAPTKAQRLQAARVARERQARFRRLGLIALLVLLVGGVVVAGLANAKSQSGSKTRLASVLTTGGCKTDTRSDPGRDHVENALYKVDPPSGGDHDPSPANAGIYEPGEVPGEPHLVHSLEHGFIILWYQRNLPPADVDKLKDLTDRYSTSTLLVPRDSIGVPVAATAWHRRLRCPGFQETPLVEFIKAYKDKGPETGFL